MLNSFLAEAKITDPAAQKIARDFMVPLYMTGLTDKDVDNVRLYWDRAVKYGFMTQPVTAKNWYTLDFVK